MIVKEASYPSLERRRLLQITDGAGALEELPLKLRGNGIPAHKHGRAQALQNLLFFLNNKGSTVVVILSPLGRLIDMDCHPFFVFGKRCVGLLEIAEFPRFLRRAQLVSSLPAPWLALIGRCWTHSLGASVELRLSKIAHFSWPMRSKTIFGERSLRRALSE